MNDQHAAQLIKAVEEISDRLEAIENRMIAHFELWEGMSTALDERATRFALNIETGKD